MFDDEPEETPNEEQPEETTPGEPETSAQNDASATDGDAEAPAEQPVAEEPAAPEEPAAEEPAAEEPAPEKSAPSRPASKSEEKSDVIPGAHLEPDLVLDEPTSGEYGDRAGAEIQAAEESFDPSQDGEAGDATPAAEEPAPRPLLELAANARYHATGKRKRAIARVIIKPGTGVYTINGRELDEFFPRPTLQRTARGPLETAGQEERMDVVAKIHGGGVSSQAGALRHGIAKALVEADANLRSDLKRRGFLTRDPRVKERKKAGLKKARKRPQFSKR